MPQLSALGPPCAFQQLKSPLVHDEHLSQHGHIKPLTLVTSNRASNRAPYEIGPPAAVPEALTGTWDLVKPANAKCQLYYVICRPIVEDNMRCFEIFEFRPQIFQASTPNYSIAPPQPLSPIIEVPLPEPHNTCLGLASTSRIGLQENS